MRAVLQRVNKASVTVNGETVSAINKGLLVLLGVSENDEKTDMEWVAEKISTLRIFEDDHEKMNLSIKDVGGTVLLVSQFTLYGDAQKGRRPSFSEAAKPEIAREFYTQCGKYIERNGVPVRFGVFGAMMRVSLENDGPVTILLDSKR
jgi:D-tyrosyl-tRNA(Tyr) deacylase